MPEKKLVDWTVPLSRILVPIRTIPPVLRHALHHHVRFFEEKFLYSNLAICNCVNALGHIPYRVPQTYVVKVAVSEICDFRKKIADAFKKDEED